MKAETIAKALAGRRAGGGWMAHCPAHDDREPSLSIRQGAAGKPLVCCHAGCDQRRLIKALRSRGLWDQNGHCQFPPSASRGATYERPDRDEAKRSGAALAVWQATAPAHGTLAETYLVLRGLKLPLLPRLHFHAGLKHPSGRIWPAMVALVTRGDDDTPIAIHRTFLARNGAGKAPVGPPKMMLGPCRGGAVRLGLGGDVLMVGEGIERPASLLCWRPAIQPGRRCPPLGYAHSICHAPCGR